MLNKQKILQKNFYKLLKNYDAFKEYKELIDAFLLADDSCLKFLDHDNLFVCRSLRFDYI